VHSEQIELIKRTLKDGVGVELKCIKACTHWRQKVSVSGDKWIQMDTFCHRFRRLLLPFQATFVAENGYL